MLVDFDPRSSASSAQMSRPASRHSLLVCLVIALWGCDGPSAGECKIGADCASGICGDDGQCNTNDGPDADVPRDAGPDGRVSACGGQVDDQILRDELPLQAGVKADFRFGSSATFDSAGELIEGQRSWDLDQNFANDVDGQVELFSLTGAWYQETFPSASYTALLSQSSELLGVFRLADDGLYLLGVVSPQEGLTRTELTYDPPALLMPLPLSEGKTWSTSSSVSGLASGIFSIYSEEYEGNADAAGTLITPFGSFRVIRNRILLTRTVGLLVTVTRQFSFVSECAGIVATLVSNEGEEQVEFSDIAELRRLIP